jgi:hypothetical protein
MKRRYLGILGVLMAIVAFASTAHALSAAHASSREDLSPPPGMTHNSLPPGMTHDSLPPGMTFNTAPWASTGELSPPPGMTYNNKELT